MKKRSAFLIGVILLTGVCGLALPSYADVLPPSPPAGADTDLKFKNPIGTDSVVVLLSQIISWLIYMSAVLALFALVYGGIRLITSLSNESQVQSAKRIILWAIAGLVVILVSFVVINTVKEVLGVL